MTKATKAAKATKVEVPLQEFTEEFSGYLAINNSLVPFKVQVWGGKILEDEDDGGDDAIIVHCLMVDSFTAFKPGRS